MGSAYKDMDGCGGHRLAGEGHRTRPERPDLHNLLGFCHFKLADHEAGGRHFPRAIDLDPTSAIDYANLGVNYQALGETKKAIQCFRLALSLDAGIEFARQHLARLEP